MKIDKDFLLKHKFWVMVAACVPLCLIAILVLVTAVSAEIAKRRTYLEGELKKLRTANKEKIYSPAERDLEKDFAEGILSKENDIWKKAWDLQKQLFVWPKPVEDRFKFQDGLFAREVKVLSKEAKMGEDGIELPADEAYVKHGVVTKSHKDYIEVEGKNKASYKFRFTPQVRVSAADDPGIKAWNHIPDKSVVSVEFHEGKYFMDPLTPNEEAEYTRNGVDVYRAQLHEILEQVQPIDTRGNGVVQLKGWAYNKEELPKTSGKFLIFMDKDTWTVKTDFFQDAWLAQEDFWIQKELYRVVRQANDYVSDFTKDPKRSKGAKHGVYTNPYWELEITWDGARKLDLKVKNLLPRRQKLDTTFLVKMHGKFAPERVLLGGEPLSPGEIREVPYLLSEGGIRERLFPDEKNKDDVGVRQVLTWETAAVKRIDQVSIGTAVAGDVSHSHRTYVDGLKGLVKEEEKKDDPGDKKGQPGVKPGGNFGNQNQDLAKLTINGLVKNRYVDMVYEQRRSRRVPVAMSLIVDQDHVDRVQTSFGNSKLRFLTTQVLLNRYPYSVEPRQSAGQGEIAKSENPPPGVGDKGPPGGVLGKPPPGLGKFPMGGFPFPPQGPGKGPMGFDGGFPGQGQAAGPSEDLETNVEMVIYGIVTLYERYPARPTEAPVPTK